MTLSKFLELAIALGCKVQNSYHKGVFRVVVSDQEKFIAGDMRKDVVYQYYLPGNSLPTKGSSMSYEEALKLIEESEVTDHVSVQ